MARRKLSCKEHDKQRIMDADNGLKVTRGKMGRRSLGLCSVWACTLDPCAMFSHYEPKNLSSVFSS